MSLRNLPPLLKEKPGDLPGAHYRVVRTYMKPGVLGVRGSLQKEILATVLISKWAVLFKNAELGTNRVQHISGFWVLISANARRGDEMSLRRGNYNDCRVYSCEYFP